MTCQYTNIMTSATIDGGSLFLYIVYCFWYWEEMQVMCYNPSSETISFMTFKSTVSKSDLS